MSSAEGQRFKIPESVLVVIHTPALEVLLIQRADTAQGVEHWQSVTGSKDHWDEPWEATAAREVQEETGIDVQAPGCRLTDWGLENHYDIWPQWRHRYAPGVTHNTERVFGLAQLAGIVFGVMALAWPWGRRVATTAGVFGVLLTTTAIGLTALAWDGAVALLVFCISYCAKHETDGFVHSGTVARLSPVQQDRDRQVGTLIAEGALHEHEDGFVVNDYLIYNRSKEQIEAQRKEDRERKARSRK